MKPFKGVIGPWYKAGDTIIGKIVWHKDHVGYHFRPGQIMQTSPVVKITKRASFHICETRNSFYVLLDKLDDDFIKVVRAVS